MGVHGDRGIIWIVVLIVFFTLLLLVIQWLESLPPTNIGHVDIPKLNFGTVIK